MILTGAGVSAESGLKTFRDHDGLWNGYNIEDVATPRAWKKNPEMVLEFYNLRRKEIAKAEPNAAHYAFAKLQEDFHVHIITQNIDDLHERAGSRNVLHLHGEIFKMRCEKHVECIYDIREDILPGSTSEKGFQLRPHIVWFEEPVPLITYASEIAAIADIFVVAGTSLAVYPAAGLLDYAPYSIPKFILDKKIPQNTSLYNLKTIEKPASAGVADLVKALEILR